MAFKCGTCGQVHAGMPMDLGFARPRAFFNVPPEDRASRCMLTSDWCVIDERRFYIRGCLAVPVLDAESDFVWGIWTRIGKRSFQRYLELYSADGSAEPPFRGRLSVEDRSGYEGLNGKAVRVQLRAVSERPSCTLARSAHLLYREQRKGITLHRVHEILRTLFPEQFG